MKRIISFILAIIMLISIVPVDLAYANDAVDAPVAQGKIKVEYKDSNTNAAIDPKYQLKGQEYPAEKNGDMNTVIKNEVFDMGKAPKFLGYKIKSITTAPVPNPPATANYTKDGDYTVIYTYDKLDDIKGPLELKPTDEFPDGYVAVKFFADESNNRGEFSENKTVVVYAVNPINTEIDKDAKTLKGKKADGSAINLEFPTYSVKDDFKATWKTNDTAPWVMNPNDAIKADKKIDVNKLGQQQDITFTAQYTEVNKPGNCLTEDDLKAQFEEAIDPMFENIKNKDGVYLGKYDKANKKVTVAIIDKTKPFKELKGTGLVAGIKDLLKNHNLIKYQVGNQEERDLKAIESVSADDTTLIQNLAQIVGSDIGNEIAGAGKSISTLADFIGKSVTLKLTVQEPNCEGNAVELTYTIEGKEAVSSILKDKLTPQDIKVWKGDTIDWEMGVNKDETGLTDTQKEQIKDEFSTLENGVKKTKGKAQFEDASKTPRDSKAVSSKPFEGTIKVTFSDGSELLVKNQNLYVSELMTGKDNQNAPEDAITVQFLLGNGVKANKGTETLEGPKLYETYKVKPNLDLDNYKLGTNKTIFATINPESTNTAKFKNIVWTPESHVATEKNNKFTATATELFIMKHTFKLIDKDNNNAEINALPKVLTDKLPKDETVAKGETYTPAKLDAIKEVKDGDNFYDYTFGNWNPTSAKDEDKTFVGTWTREQSTSEKPAINKVTPGDKDITGKGKKGAEIEVTIPGVKDSIKTKVNQNGDWTVKVPEDKKLKTGEEIVVTQKELGKKPNSDNTKVGEGPKPQPMPTPEYNPWWHIYSGSTKTEAKKETKKETKTVAPEAKYGLEIAAPYLSPKFTDVPADLATAVEYLATRGIMVGTSETTFSPKSSMTRAMVVATLYRISADKNFTKVEKAFTDVKSSDWFYEAVLWAKKNGIVAGYEEGDFKPNKNVSRQEFAVIIMKFLKDHGIDMPKVEEFKYSDEKEIPTWSKDAVELMKKIGLIEGLDGTNYKPYGEYSRGELAETLYKLIQFATK